ncbi:hypothetical protein [uncultured Thiodictyon sp.]|uniref:hypothetical protein n=1 Tax=uncultured Thiodictyon sp. TaxID=1846217 RepID=UPI0025F4280D|nr:hypothetical protein [uncultured Thiodictyon sp.]
MSASLPPLVQDSGVPFDLFIQALTEQLDKAQAAMAVKARVAKLPLTFAVKDVSLDLRAFVSMVDDEIYIRPARPGDGEASSIRLALTTITKPMIEENAVDFAPEDPRFNLRDALGDSMSEDDQRRLERIGVRTVTQLNELKRTAGADVIARLSRLPVNRLQQALVRAAAPRVTTVQPLPAEPIGSLAPAPRPAVGGAVSAPLPTPGPATIAPAAARLKLRGINLMQAGRAPVIRSAGMDVPIVLALEHELVIEPAASQLGQEAQIDFGDGQSLTVHLAPHVPTAAAAGGDAGAGDGR